MSLKVLDIAKQHNFLIDESILWSILSSGVIVIQNKISARDYELCLLSLENMYISEAGKFYIKRDTNLRYSRSYVMPEIIELMEDWYKGDDRRKEEILLFSLGISLRLCMRHGKHQMSTYSPFLGSILDQITDRNAAKRLNLAEVLRICCTEGKEFTKGKTYNYILSMFYKSFNDQRKTENGSKMIRSLSQSNLKNGRPSLDYSRPLSLGNIQVDPSPTELLRNDSTTKTNGHRQGLNVSNSNSISSQSTSASENNINKGNLISSSNYENLMLNAIDNRPNITEAIERVKARRKVIKRNGPVKFPTQLSESLNHSLTENLEYFNGQILQSQGSRLSASFNEPLEISTIERISGFRHILGPEFAIRCNETFNVTFNTQKRNSIFSRTNSGRLIRTEIMVHLLNGVVLLVRNLSNRSTTSQVINAIHHALPDLEFVTYGLCFTLDSEYFFLKDDVNVYNLINYVSRKTNQARSEERNDPNNGLHLYYRLKYYPTVDIFRDMNASDRRLLYLQLRQDLLYRNVPPISVPDALFLAGAAIHTEYGDNSEHLQEDLDYLKMKYYFQQSFITLFNVTDREETFLRKQQSAWLSMKWCESETIFIEKLMSCKYYGFHWYKVNKTQLTIIGAIGKESFLVLDRYCIELVDVNRTNAEVQMYRHFNYKWRQIESISIKLKKIIIKPKMQLKVEGMTASSVFVCHLDSRTKAEYIVRLCNDHHLLASQDDHDDVSFPRRDTCNDTGSHLQLSTVDYPLSLKASIDVDDDDIFIDYASSDDDVLDSFRTPIEKETMSSKYRLDCLRSLENMNRVESETSNSDLSTKNCFTFANVSHQVTDIDQEIQKDVSRGSVIFEVDLRRSKDQTIGIGIISVNITHIQGIFIKRLVPNSMAAKCNRLKVGDEIISVNNQPVSHMTQDEVSKVMSDCGTDITLVIRRHGYLEEQKNTSLKPSVESVKRTNGHSEPDLSTDAILKTNQILGDFLASSDALDHLRTKYTSIVIPPLSLNEEDRSSKRKIDSLATKELKDFRDKALWNSRNKTTVNHSIAKFVTLTINLNELICQNLRSKKEIKFLLVCVKTEEYSNNLLWQEVATNDSKLVVTLGSKITCRSLFLNNEMENNKYTVVIKEKCDLTNTIALRQLSIGEARNKVYHIQFCEWYNKKTKLDTLLQIANLACILHQNIPNNGPIVIVHEDPKLRPTDFIVTFITILLNLHCVVPFHPILKSKTLVHYVYSQLIHQSKEFLPSESQYNSCISVLKLLLPFGDRCDSSSEISDVD